MSHVHAHNTSKHMLAHTHTRTHSIGERCSCVAISVSYVQMEIMNLQKWNLQRPDCISRAIPSIYFHPSDQWEATGTVLLRV